MNGEILPDWDHINRGKVRHFFALELYKQGGKLTDSEIGTIEMYVEYVMDGADFRELIKEESDLALVSEKESDIELMSEKECTDIITARDRDAESVTAEEHTRAVIHLEANGLKDNELKSVIGALDAGEIHQGNLSASVNKINNIKSEYDKE